MMAWDVNPNQYASPYRALAEWARQLIEESRAERGTDVPADAAGCHC